MTQRKLPWEIIARKSIKDLKRRFNKFLEKLYFRETLEKQRQFGKVEIPQEAFNSVF